MCARLLAALFVLAGLGMLALGFTSAVSAIQETAAATMATALILAGIAFLLDHIAAQLRIQNKHWNGLVQARRQRQKQDGDK